MNILFISALVGRKGAGPTYSVPKQIVSQSKYDNVYWVNMSEVEDESYFDPNYFHQVNYKSFRLEQLPQPFCKPDIVIFEEFFKTEFIRIALILQKRKIPYVIVPRCQMTEKYLQNKKIKKIIASIVFFRHFARSAKSVHFLSDQEKLDSEKYYKGNYYIAANGIDIKEDIAYPNNSNKIGIFIGRYSVWQKGLDIFTEAVSIAKEELKNAGIKFVMYGPESPSGSAKDAIALVEKYNIGDLVEVRGAVFDKEKENVLRNADFFFHTSRFEGMPMSVLEALSYGLPCLVTQGSNLREVVEENQAGWGADDTVESVVQGLRRMVHDLDGFSNISKNAMDVARKYAWESISEECHTHYLKMI